MEQAYPHGYGLTAIMGLTLPQVEQLIEGTGTYIANLNAETQIVIAGADDGMAQVAERALAKGAKQSQKTDGQRAVALRATGGTGAKTCRGVQPGHALSSPLRIPERQHRPRVVAAGEDRRRSGDEYGAPYAGRRR